MAAVSKQQPQITTPDVLIHQILRLLSGKAALRMSFLSKQWEGLWYSIPVLDFDEGGKPDEYHIVYRDDLLEEPKFVNILTRYLENCEKEKWHDNNPLEKFRLRMVTYFPGTAFIVNKLLRFSIERVKELDVSLRTNGGWYSYYWVSPTTFLNAKSLTTLTLEYVRLRFDGNHASHLLPSLKTMRLKSVRFDKRALLFLIRECPSIEFLSIALCSFEFCRYSYGYTPIRFSSSSVKFVEIKHCETREIIVEEARSLESFTCVSSESSFYFVTLKKSYGLKHIDIHSQHLKEIYVFGSHKSLEATIDTPSLVHIELEGDVRHSKAHVNAPNLRTAIFTLKDVWDGELATNFVSGAWKHFGRLRNFLLEFGRPESLTLNVHGHFKALIFPKDFRKIFPPPLPYVKYVHLAMLYPPTDAKDVSDFRDSFEWMTPSANSRILNRLEI